MGMSIIQVKEQKLIKQHIVQVMSQSLFQVKISFLISKPICVHRIVVHYTKRRTLRMNGICKRLLQVLGIVA